MEPSDFSSPREAARAFTPKLSALSESPLYDKVWEDSNLSKRDRSLVTFVALVCLRRMDELAAHLHCAIGNGVTEIELATVITHLAFHAGFPAANLRFGTSQSQVVRTMIDVLCKNLRFGPFELSIRKRVLRRDGAVLPLGDRALDILIYLAKRAGEVVANRELLEHVWSDVTVEEATIRVHVCAIRKALRDGQFGNRYIANVKGRGYSFVATVVPFGGGAESKNAEFPRQCVLCVRPITMIECQAAGQD